MKGFTTTDSNDEVPGGRGWAVVNITCCLSPIACRSRSACVLMVGYGPIAQMGQFITL